MFSLISINSSFFFKFLLKAMILILNYIYEKKSNKKCVILKI